VKIKPTIIYATFCVVLLGGMSFNRLFLKYALAFEFELPESAWRTLTWRWGAFFGALAALNEFVWRNFTTADWVIFKVWIILHYCWYSARCRRHCCYDTRSRKILLWSSCLRTHRFNGSA